MSSNTLSGISYILKAEVFYKRYLQCIDKLFPRLLRKSRKGFAESETRLRNSNLFDVCGI